MKDFNLKTPTEIEHDNTDGTAYCTESYWRRTMYYPIIDAIINNLKYKYSDEYLEMAYQLIIV